MNKRVFTILVLFLSFTAIALTGKVVDQSGAPLSGVTVRLVENGASVLSGSDGSFTLTPDVPVNAQSGDRSLTRMRLQDGVLFFTPPHSGAMSLRTLDVAGNEIASSTGMLGMEGEVQYSVFGSRPHSPGVYLVQIRIGTTTGTIRIAATKHGLATGSFSGSAHPSLMRGVVLQAVDSLSFSKSGFLTRRLPVANDTQNLGTVVLSRDFGISWNSAITYGTLADARDGQTYRTVRIGTQRWMAENLNYRNTTGSVDTVGQCYENRADSCAKYGRLYTWAELMQGASSSALSPSGVKGVCPSGWHVPSDAEWTTLMTAVGGEATAGTKLKSAIGWKNGGNGADEYGYRALPGGYASSGSFDNVGGNGIWWSTTEFYSTGAWYRYMYNYSAYASRNNNSNSFGFSARCLKD